MSKFSQLIESISSKEMVEADKLFESILAEKISEGLTARENLIQEEVMAANPDLFQSPVDQAAALAHAPVEAEHSERTDEIDVPEPVEVDGHRDADPSEEEQEAMNEEYGMEQIVLESHDFEADEDEQHQHPENVAKVPVGASAETNQGTVDMEPSQASPEQIEEEEMCEECAEAGLTECECMHEESEDLHEVLGPITPGMIAAPANAQLGYTAGKVGRGIVDAIKNPGTRKALASKATNIAKNTAKAARATGITEDEVEEELSPKQKKIDLNKNGKIDGSDLAKLRKEEEGTDEPGKPKGDELEEGKGPDKAPRSRRSPYTVGDKIARTAGNLAGAAGAATAAGKAADAMNAGLPARAGMVAGAGAAGAVLAGTAARQLNRRMRGAKE